MIADNVFKTFKSNYGRTGYFAIGIAICDVCKKEARCLVSDTAEAEYGPANICMPCIELYWHIE